MASECSGGLSHTFLLQLFSSSALASPSHQLHSREKFFLEAKSIFPSAMVPGINNDQSLKLSSNH